MTPNPNDPLGPREAEIWEMRQKWAKRGLTRRQRLLAVVKAYLVKLIVLAVVLAVLFLLLTLLNR